jgi:beta-glucosidase-like glycosyl hydrolase/class 3 adenylate cyclase
MAQRPEWMVGQVCMVGIWGSNFDPSPEIRQKWQETIALVQRYHVGSVILFTSNFSNVPDTHLPSTVEQVASICREVQRLAADAAAREGLNAPPLFVAIDHEGDGVSWTRIRTGLTPIPSNLAVGATWDTQFAGQVGEAVGGELSLLGINMLLGPVLDINTDPGKDAMGERCFGGDPCWAGRLGRAYIRGVHKAAAGLGRAMAVVAKHWPGHGDCDRLEDYEVACLSSTIEELSQKELPPFLAVIGASQVEERPDALMPTHSVYSNIQQGSDPYPITLDASGDAVGTLLAAAQGKALSPLAEEGMRALAAWRGEGLIVGDALGVDALIAHYESRGYGQFPYGDAAYRCLLAGQDIVMLTGYGKWEQQMAVMDYLVAAYRRGMSPGAGASERQFVKRVQEAARQVLEAKLRLSGGRPEALGGPAAAPGEVARQMEPLVATHVQTLYEQPSATWRRAVQWVKKAGFAGLPADANIVTVEPEPLDRVAAAPPKKGLVADLILRKQPRASASTVERLKDTEVRALLAGKDPKAAERAGKLLAKATWVVVALTHRPRRPEDMEEAGGIDAVRWSLLLIRKLPALFPGAQRKRVAVIACQVPYYLGASDTAAVDAYLVTHSKLERYVEAAVDALLGLRDAAPLASPVSIPGARYCLADVLKPAAEQKRWLKFERGAEGRPPRLVAGPLADTAGRPVPDGGQVQLMLEYRGRGQAPTATLSACVVDGVATCPLPADAAGKLVAVTATAEGLAPERLVLTSGRVSWPAAVLLILAVALGAGLWHRRRRADYARVPEVLYTFVAVDVRDSTAAKAGQDPAAVRRTFDAYHQWVRTTMRSCHGDAYSTSGDGVLSRFARAADALAAGRALRDGLAEFNEQSNRLSQPLAIGIGIHTGPVLEKAREEHGRVASTTLDVAMKLQAHAGAGEILLSAETASRLPSREGLQEAGKVLGEITVYRAS